MKCLGLTYTRICRLLRYFILATIIGFCFNYFSLISDKSSISVRVSGQKRRSADEKKYSQSFRLYSAFIDKNYNLNTNVSTNKVFLLRPQIIAVIWQTTKIINSFKCCIHFQGMNKIITSDSTKISHCYHETGLLRASRIKCPLVINVSKLFGISLAKWNMDCPTDTRYYVIPTILDQALKKNKWAMCNKYLYGAGPNARRLVEWFEIHRFLGVDKFTIHHENTIKSTTKKVLQFYRMEGLADVLHIDAPYNDTINRHDHQPRYELFNDELVGLWDCRERHKYYEFSADIDTDELILPTVMKENGIKKILADTFRRRPVGVVAFYTYTHITSWEPTNATYPMFIGKYETSTEPLIEATKNMYMSSRIKIEEGTIHSLYPKRGFTRIYLDPRKAAVHHFRQCRPSWFKPFQVKIFRNRTVTQVNATCRTLSRVRPLSKKRINIEKLRKTVEQVYLKLQI